MQSNSERVDAGNLDHLSDNECRSFLEGVYEAMEGETERRLLHPSGESEEANIVECVAGVLAERDAALALLLEVYECVCSWRSRSEPALCSPAPG